MFPGQSPPGKEKITLAIFNHRGDDLRDMGRILEKFGFSVLHSNNLEQTVQLLENEQLNAAIVVPLTLSATTLEWHELFQRLSPQTSIPWLILPWAEAEVSQVNDLLHGKKALADWLRAPFAPLEVEARIRNLLRFQELWAASMAKSDRLAAQLIVDHKTGLFNDRHFRTRLSQEFSRTQRHLNPMTLLLLDIDNFKQINDLTTYEFGDTVLRSIAEIIRHSIRTIDIPARIGGDEYAVLMPDTNLEDGVSVATRILSSAENLIINDQNYRSQVQLSIGASSYSGQELTASTQLFLEANEALKAAKSAGKNRVFFYNRRQSFPAE